MLLDSRYIKSFDFFSFFIVLILSFISICFVFSATYTESVPYSIFFKKQLFGVISGLVIYVSCCLLDYRTIERSGYFLYFGSIALLIFTLFKGTIGLGAQRWINLGLFKFQPSELIKLFFPPFFSYYLYTERDSGQFRGSDFLPIIAILMINFILILKQPDLGTALIILFAGGSMLWFAGLNKKFFISSILLVSVTAPFLYKCLKPYQKKRIEVFLGFGDSKKERYQIEQSRIAIGSGGILGKGFLKGTQNKLSFLPEGRTDFIFAVLCEELGFMGGFIIILLYVLLFIRCLYIITTISNFFVQLLATGYIIHILFSAIINISMVMGLMPIVGIPLPLMSYGISHLWITYASLGCFNGIAMRRFYLSINKL